MSIFPPTNEGVILVGNGTPPAPGVIDSFSYIMRINQFKLGADWGEKVDVHVSPVWPAYVRRFARFPRYVLLVPDIRSGMSTRTTGAHLNAATEHIRECGSSTVAYVPEVSVEYAKAWNRGNHPTTGLTVAIALTACRSKAGLTLAGFDLVHTDQVKLLHSHNARAEHESFKMLLEEGWVKVV